jgi:hypothetical protein
MPGFEQEGDRKMTLTPEEKQLVRSTWALVKPIQEDAALLWTLEQGLGEEFTPEVEDSVGRNVLDPGDGHEGRSGEGGGVSNLWRKRGSSLWGQYGRKERSLSF